MILVKDNNGKIHQTTDGTNAIIPSLNVAQEVLWTNPNPNQTFQPQSVNLIDNYTNYDILVFTFYNGESEDKYQYTLYTKNANSGTIVVVDSNKTEYSTPNWYGRRHFTLNGNVCTFTQGAANISIANDVAKPIQIIGLKFLDTLNYSTEEQYTGKHWIDGKKIYQKTFVGSMPNANTMYTQDFDCSNVDIVIDTIKGDLFYVPTIISENHTRWYIDRTTNKFNIIAQNAQFVGTYNQTIKYTKIT